MDDLIDMIIADKSASSVSDKIKDVLYSKASERVDSLKPSVSTSIFGDEEYEDGTEQE
jgi:hypothetical protein